MNDAAEEYSDSGAIRRNQTEDIHFLAIAMTFTILTAETIKFKVSTKKMPYDYDATFTDQQ